ncbi:MAG: hypothetical protein KF726_20975 [Anaerolineae bacterium]|nr:hypothetical protein [Anaerolineae bacterium]
MANYSLDKKTTPTVAQDSVLRNIREDMEIKDAEGKHIGKVRTVVFGEATPTENVTGTGAATAPDRKTKTDVVVDTVADALVGDDDIPEVYKARMRHDGYIRIDSAGLFKSDRYALMEQISRVDEHVHLKVRADELIHR